MTAKTRNNYECLDPQRILATVHQLQVRIKERFPQAGLNKVCQRLSDISEQARARTEKINQPNLFLRIGIGLLIALIGALVSISIWYFSLPQKNLDLYEFMPLFESAINNFFFIGVGIYFLVTMEQRIKRHRALDALHELRALAHIIDMHQLTKDPERVGHSMIKTPSSPAGKLTRFELRRYLNYCSEMLSISGKIAALYVQRFSDPVTLNSVNDIEDLTTSLSRKIWQKIIILHQEEEGEATTSRRDLW